MQYRVVPMLLTSVLLGTLFASPPEKGPPADSGVLFTEGFEDGRLLERGWYDGDKFEVTRELPYAGTASMEYRWKAGATNPKTSVVRRLFEPTETVYLRFHIRLSKNWGWTGREYHPHLINFMTTENGK